MEMDDEEDLPSAEKLEEWLEDVLEGLAQVGWAGLIGKTETEVSQNQLAQGHKPGGFEFPLRLKEILKVLCGQGQELILKAEQVSQPMKWMAL
ncbi:hypothetical protein E5288_WYG013786 [Bos mutus]|uniref:Calsequestrin n=1 Tax=Bos mutus TaxID=72004 RepID=A0A6B0QUY4_9CETA|nr:hypothetical protein [Bos mutus]